MAVLLPRPIEAALLVREGYDAYATGNLASDTPINGATGLSGNYVVNNLGPFTILDGSLAFGSYNSSAGKRVQGTSAGGTTLAATVATGVSATGTLWNSYLVNTSVLANGATGLAEVRMTNVFNQAGGDSYFRSQTNLSSSVSTETGVGYEANASSPPASGVSLTAGTTYLVVTKFTGVGASTGSRTGSQYVMSLSQYNDFALSGFSESNLAGRAVGTGAGQITSFASDTYTGGTAYSFESGKFIQLATLGDTVTWDELRYGTTLNDVVTTVPEPGVAALSLLGLASLVWLPRRRPRTVAVKV